MRVRSAIILAALFAITLFSVHAKAAGELTLEEAWKLAIESDPQLQSYDEAMKEAGAEKFSATAPFLPKIDGDVRLRHFMKEEGFVWDASSFGQGILDFPATEKTVPSVSTRIEQMIFDSGKSIMGYKSQARAYESAGFAVFGYRQDRAVDLVKAYCDYYLALKRLEVAKDSQRALEEYERVSRARYEQNLAPKTDLLTAEVSAAKAKMEVVRAEDAIAVARMALASLIGEDPNAVADPLVPRPPADRPRDVKRPEIMAKRAEAKSAEYAAKKATLSYLPDIYAGAEAAYIDDDYRINKDQYTLWTGLRWPILDGLYEYSQRKVSMARARRARLESEAMENAFSTELEDASRAWSRADEEISIASLNKSRSTENLKDAKLAYREGMVSALDLRDAISLWSEATFEYYQSLCNKEISAAALRRAIGLDVFDGGDNRE